MKMHALLTLALLTVSCPAATLVDWTFTGLANPAHGGSNTNIAAGTTVAAAGTYAAPLAGVNVGDVTYQKSSAFPTLLQWSIGNSVASGELNLELGFERDRHHGNRGRRHQ